MPAGATPLPWQPAFEAPDPRWTGLERPGSRLIRSSREWEDTWRRLTRGVVPIPAPPPVDFHTEVVALLATGRGREIEITGAWRAGDLLFVEAVEVVPGEGCAVAPTGESAVAAIRVPRWHGIEGRFIERIETRRCPH